MKQVSLNFVGVRWRRWGTLINSANRYRIAKARFIKVIHCLLTVKFLDKFKIMLKKTLCEDIRWQIWYLEWSASE